MTPRRKRMLTVALILAGVGISVAFALQAFQKNLLYFYSPSQVEAGEAPQSRTIRVGDQRRLNAEHGAMGKGRCDADMFDIQKIADRHVEQESVFLHDREHSSLSVRNVFEVQVQPEHQPAPADVCDQQRVLALELPQLLLQALPDRSHLPHQALCVLGQLMDCRQCCAAR